MFAGLKEKGFAELLDFRVVLARRKIDFEVVLIRGDHLLHEEKVAVEIVGQKKDGKEVINVGLYELL